LLYRKEFLGDIGSNPRPLGRFLLMGSVRQLTDEV